MLNVLWVLTHSFSHVHAWKDRTRRNCARGSQGPLVEVEAGLQSGARGSLSDRPIATKCFFF